MRNQIYIIKRLYVIFSIGSTFNTMIWKTWFSFVVNFYTNNSRKVFHALNCI